MNYRFTCSLIIICAFVALFSNCRSISRNKRILYDRERSLKLNVFAPKKTTANPVLVFVHGGNWKSGKISTYNFFAKRMAARGIVTVVVQYRLAPDTNYAGMAMDVARSIKWVKENCAAYGGNPDKIVVSGHSAGAHLAALVATDNRYFDSLGMNNNPIKGAVMIDAFGLNMYHYLLTYQDNYNGIYYPTFGTDQDVWQKGSPYYYLHKGMPPFLMFLGGKTFPAIKDDTQLFYGVLKKYQPGAQLIHNPKRNHFGMMLQFYSSGNKGYGQMVDFIGSVTR